MSLAQPGPGGHGSEALTCTPVRGIGEVTPGDDLASALCAAAHLTDGDVLVVTSKVVSKAAGLVRRTGRQAAVAEETDRVVARRGATTIVRNRQGLVMAAAGVDGSNTEPGTVVLLPHDPDDAARRLREAIAGLTGHNVAVVVSDTSGRAWRNGQTDIAIGAAGLPVVQDYAGTVDGYGNPLVVTAMAVADEVAAAADLVKGKIAGAPAAVVRGLADLVQPAGRHGPGARALIRPEPDDLFGYGAREAVTRAVHADPEGLRGFGRPCTAEELAAELGCLGGPDVVCTAAAADLVEVSLPPSTDVPAARRVGRLEARLTALAFACGWTALDGAGHGLGFRPGASVH